MNENEYRKVKRDELECKDFFEDIIGYTGEEFCSRPVVLFRQRPGVFGSTSVKKDKVRRYTLHNGILNQCAIHSDGRPGVYWAVLDTMSDLKVEFTKEQVIDRATQVMKKYNGRCRGNLVKAVTTAFYILKTHVKHPARKNMGFGFIIDKLQDKKMSIRGRGTKEGVPEKPLATVLVNERG